MQKNKENQPSKTSDWQVTAAYATFDAEKSLKTDAYLVNDYPFQGQLNFDNVEIGVQKTRNFGSTVTNGATLNRNLTADFGDFNPGFETLGAQSSFGLSKRICTLENLLQEEGVNQDEIREMIKVLRHRKTTPGHGKQVDPVSNSTHPKECQNSNSDHNVQDFTKKSVEQTQQAGLGASQVQTSSQDPSSIYNIAVSIQNQKDLLLKKVLNLNSNAEVTKRDLEEWIIKHFASEAQSKNRRDNDQLLPTTYFRHSNNRIEQRDAQEVAADPNNVAEFILSIRTQTKKEENIYGTIPDTDRSSEVVITQYGGVSNLDSLNRDTMEPEILSSVTRYAEMDNHSPR